MDHPIVQPKRNWNVDTQTRNRNVQYLNVGITQPLLKDFSSDKPITRKLLATTSLIHLTGSTVLPPVYHLCSSDQN